MTLAQWSPMKHPNLAWEDSRADGSVVSCLILSGLGTHVVVQYVDETVSEVEEFDDLVTARRRVRALYETLRRPAGSPRESTQQRRKSGSPVGASAPVVTQRQPAVRRTY